MTYLPRLLASIALATSTVLAFGSEAKHNYDLKNVLWHLNISMADQTIAGDVTNTLTLSEDAATVQLHCAELSVSAVSVDGVSAKFSNPDDVLTVTLPVPAKAGQTLNIRTIYTGKPVNGLYFVQAEHAFPARTGMVYTQGEGEDNHFWLPTYDKPDDKATSECFITVPATWTALSNGRLLDVKDTPGGKVFHWKMDQPFSTYLINLIAGEYVAGHDTWHGKPVDWYVPPGLEAQGKASFGNTAMMVDFYSKTTGVDYPYPKFAQAVVGDFMFGGMENVTCVTQTIRTLHALGTEPVNDSTGLVAHELAHHWFGDLVTCKTWEHTWLNEGLTTNIPVYLERFMHGQDAFDISRYGTFEGAIDTIGSRNRKDMPGAVGSSTTVNIGSPYAGGSARMLALMNLISEPIYWKGIQAYLTKYQFSNATTDEFFEVMGKVAKKDLKSFEKQWFYSNATPSVTVSVAGTDLVINQLQPYFTLDIPVWILTTPTQVSLFSAPTWERKMVHLTNGEARLPLGPQASMPILADPEVWIPMELTYKIPYTPDQIVQIYRHAPNCAQKARLIAEFFPTLPLTHRVQLTKNERNGQLLQMMASRLQQDGIAQIVTLTRNSDKGVENASVVALGSLKSDPKALTRVQEIAEKDPNESIREHATQVLLNWSTDDKLAQKTWKLKAFDDGYRIMALDWWSKNNPEFARTTSLGILKSPDTEALRVKAIQVLGQLKEKPGEHVVYDVLLPIAQETTIAARRAAISALGELGNKAAIPILTPFTLHGPGTIRGTATAAIANLSK